MKLKISTTLQLPPDAATQTFAIVARKRVGKTYTASVMAEEFIKAGIPIAVLDPTGAWWGLRSSADGESEGFPVVIIGGEHADVPLDEHSGKIIADLVVDHPGYYIIDFSLMESEAAQDRFATDFGTRFYRRKASNKFPIQLMIDEADCFLPQRPFPNQTKMLGAYDNIVRRGGIHGIGVTLITQRPAVLNKNVLTQAETLIALQMSGSQDIDAIEHWIRVHGTKAQREEMIGSIASLQRGECWFWSPSWLEKFERVQIRERTTFNSSATPQVGEKVVIAKKLAKVDIESLGERIKAAAEKVKENDPAELRRKITALERQLAEKPITQNEVKEVPMLTAEERKKIEALIAQFTKAHERMERGFMEVAEAGKVIGALKPEINSITAKLAAPSIQATPQSRPTPYGLATAIYERNNRTTLTPAHTNGALPKCERAILTAAIQRLPKDSSRAQLALIAGYSVNSGGFNNAMGKLRSLGYMEGCGDQNRPTQQGLEKLPEVPPLPTSEHLLDYWKAKLPKAERAILTMIAFAPDGISREELGAQTGYSPGSGGFNNALGKLRILELIQRGWPAKPSPDLL